MILLPLFVCWLINFCLLEVKTFWICLKKNKTKLASQSRFYHKRDEFEKKFQFIFVINPFKNGVNTWIFKEGVVSWWKQTKNSFILTFCMQQNKTNQAKAYNNNNPK